MAGFREIIGHNQIVSHLQNAIRMDKVSHAYIFNGEEYAGKMMLAEAFAMALQCEEHRSEPCMRCRSCRQMLEHNQPDIIYVRHEEAKSKRKNEENEKPTNISVDDIRTQINNDISIKPYSSKYKIYIVDYAEKMTIQAQNALLKTIEEPPSYAIVLLLTTNADSFLPTILSRCITLNLKSVKEDLIKTHLMKYYHIPDYQAEVCTAFAQGNVGRAIQLASSEEFYELKQSVLSLVKKIHGLEFYELNQIIKDMTLYKKNMNEYLDLFLFWYRDVLYVKATNDITNLIFKDEVYDIKKQATKIEYFGIENILEAIETARIRLKANVNFHLTLKLMLLTIKEN